MIYAGIDEAGYGPLLGPLCVGTSAFSLAEDASQPVDRTPGAPDLWSLWSAAVARQPRDKRRRIAVADSKKLKSAGRQPLIHLERGVLAFASEEVASDRALFSSLGVHAHASASAPWHALDLPLPDCHTAGELAIARSNLRRTLDRCGSRIEAFGVAALDAPAFNDLYRRLGNKARVNMSLVFDAMRQVDLLRGDTPAFIAIDRQGGRSGYQDELEAYVARGRTVRTIHEDGERSTYEVGSGLVVSFEVAAEERHLPVALASMGAKYVRELFMRRMNTYFSERMPELEPTAGYVEDGRRFLTEVKPVLLRESIPESEFARVV